LGGDGPIFLRAGLISDDGIRLQGGDRFRTDVAVPSAKFSVGRDTFVTTKGNSVGRTGYIPLDLPPCVYSPHLSYWRSLDKDTLHPEFLRYWARSPAFAAQLHAMAHGTDMAPYLSLIDQKRLVIALPPIHEQRGVAHILGALDDKIESNNRLARVLDALGEAVFERWFADQADSITVPVRERVRLVLGGTPPRANAAYWTGGSVAWIASGEANKFRILEPTAFITPQAMAQSATKMMPSGTTVVAITGATLGKVSRLEIPACANQSVVGLLGNGEVPDSFLFYWLRTAVPELLRRQTGAAQQHVNKNDVGSLSIPLATQDEVARLSLTLDPLLKSVGGCLREARTLAGIRHSLLPKLVSGDIRVPDTSDPNEVIGPVTDMFAAS